MSITMYQAAAARAGLGVKREILAKEANVSTRTITDFERGAREPIGATKAALKTALEALGAEFPPDGGVRLPKDAIAAYRSPGAAGLD